MNLKTTRQAGRAFNVKWTINPGRQIWSQDGSMRTLGKKTKSFLVLRGIYISPKWVVMEKIESNEFGQPPKYQVLEEEDTRSKEIIEFVSNRNEGGGE